MKNLIIGYSPCPNDTFIFYALTHARIDCGDLRFRERLEDVETLNRLALGAELDITKISYHAFGHLRRHYRLLSSGSALGRRCGPLLIAAEADNPRSLRGKKIAIPGRLTTAFLLLQLYDKSLAENTVEMPFNEIVKAVAERKVDAGLIIHESRFTYSGFGLVSLLDLGRWWEGETGLPIPLGGILVRQSIGTELINQIERLVELSVSYALEHPDEPEAYIKKHSQELDDSVIRRHIGLYVNKFTVNLGYEGREAIKELLSRAEKLEIIPKASLAKPGLYE